MESDGLDYQVARGLFQDLGSPAVAKVWQDKYPCCTPVPQKDIYPSMTDYVGFQWLMALDTKDPTKLMIHIPLIGNPINFADKRALFAAKFAALEKLALRFLSDLPEVDELEMLVSDPKKHRASVKELMDDLIDLENDVDQIRTRSER